MKKKQLFLAIMITFALIIPAKSIRAIGFDPSRDRELFEEDVAQKIVKEAISEAEEEVDIVFPKVAPCYYFNGNKVEVANISTDQELFSLVDSIIKVKKIGKLYKIETKK